MAEKESAEKIDFVKWFSEMNKDSGSVAGGKGANLSEIYNLKVPVPPGFVVTAQAYDYFIKKAGLDKKIRDILDKIDYQDTKQLDDSTKKIRDLIVKSNFPAEMQEEILEAYENLDTKNIDLAKGSARDILSTSSEPIFVAVRSSATTEDLAEASFAGQQESYVNIKGNEQLIEAIKKCFASLFTSRATYYRNKQGFKYEQSSLAVVIQRMVDSQKSGVIFSKDPTTGDNHVVMEAVFGLGEGIVSGSITPDKYIVSPKLEVLDVKLSNKKIAFTRNAAGGKQVVKLNPEKAGMQVLTDYEIKRLADIALKLEEHYGKPQDLEFAIEGENIFIVQTRPITTLGKEVKEEVKELQGVIVLKGLAASQGIASGKVKIVHEMEDLSKVKDGDVLVTEMTNPDMVVTMQRACAIVTDEGGLTAHAAIVSREMGIPCVVGTEEATTKLKEGEVITVDGFSGNVYKGKVGEEVSKEVLEVSAKTKTKIKVMVDLPSFAKRAAKTGVRQVGLTRIEGIIAESGKHPNYFLENNNVKDYEEIVYKGVSEIAKYFDEIWVRTSDIRSDEYENLQGAPKEKEANPMLGMHGIRYSLKHPELLKAELMALKRVSDEGKTIGVLLPQLILVEELRAVKKMLKEIDFIKAKRGVMIETPAAVQLINELCDEGIHFISFGTNDLTQYILAVDRGNEEVQDLYNEMHPAILHQLEYVVRVCNRRNVESSICGQAGSKKEMVKFLVERGIHSISVNADSAKEISDYVAEIEAKMVENTDKEPRKYQPGEEFDSGDHYVLDEGEGPQIPGAGV
jgi:pyruvate,water dikinase